MVQDNWNVPTVESRKRVTLVDVARHAGVSKSTVSLVLRDDGAVRAQTRELVLRSIEATGYVYNRKAAALRQSGHNDEIAILINSFVTPYTAEILHHFEQLALESGNLLLIASNNETQQMQARLIRRYAEHNVGGFIVCPAPGTPASTFDRLWRNGIPIVQIMREVPFGRYPAVVADNRRGIHAATRHLLGLGHRKIAFVGGDESISDYHERVSGYFDAMGEAGLPVPEGYVRPVPQARDVGRRVLPDLLGYDPDISAIVCFSDLVAFALIGAARERGLSVGRDLAITGFDDLADAELTHPALTTVRVEARDFAVNAMQQLQIHIRDPKARAERRVVPARLVVRESCGSPQSTQ